MKCEAFREPEDHRLPDACVSPGGDQPVEHCWHAYRGSYMMVLRRGFVLEDCCRCDAMRQVHAAHRG